MAKYYKYLNKEHLKRAIRTKKQISTERREEIQTKKMGY